MSERYGSVQTALREDPKTWVHRVGKPLSPYAATDVVINGDGETSRDFCSVDNAVQANILAAVADDDATGRADNVAVGARTTLNELFGLGPALRFYVEQAR